MADKSYRHIQPHSGVYPPPPRRLQNLENKRVAPNEVLQIFEFKDFMGKILSTQHLAGSKLEAVSSQPAAFRFPRLAPKTGARTWGTKNPYFGARQLRTGDTEGRETGATKKTASVYQFPVPYQGATSVAPPRVHLVAGFSR